jgi:uncharacterized repeat protein (TIGR03803 family)
LNVKIDSGVIYGTTNHGGRYNCGSIYKVNIDGSGYTLVHSFNNLDGACPVASVVISGSVLYGTTCQGGDFGYGTIYRIHKDGTGYAVLHSFNYTGGSNPYSELI